MRPEYVETLYFLFFSSFFLILVLVLVLVLVLLLLLLLACHTMGRHIGSFFFNTLCLLRFVLSHLPLACLVSSLRP